MSTKYMFVRFLGFFCTIKADELAIMDDQIIKDDLMRIIKAMIGDVIVLSTNSIIEISTFYASGGHITNLLGREQAHQAMLEYSSMLCAFTHWHKDIIVDDTMYATISERKPSIKREMLVEYPMRSGFKVWMDDATRTRIISEGNATSDYDMVYDADGNTITRSINTYTTTAYAVRYRTTATPNTLPSSTPTLQEPTLLDLTDEDIVF